MGKMQEKFDSNLKFLKRIQSLKTNKIAQFRDEIFIAPNRAFKKRYICHARSRAQDAILNSHKITRALNRAYQDAIFAWLDSGPQDARTQIFKSHGKSHTFSGFF